MIACNVSNLQVLYSRNMFLVIKDDYDINVAQGLAMSACCFLLQNP